MAGKKHPLEIYKKHGSFAGRETSGSPVANGGKAKTGGAEKKRSSPSGKGKTIRTLKPPKMSESSKSGRGKASPGEQLVSLRMNTVLLLLGLLVPVSIGLYSLGYYKGKNTTDVPALQQKHRLADPYAQSEVSDNKEITIYGDNGSRYFYGIQVGTWDVSKLDIAKEADQWLRKKGYDSKLYPLPNRKDYIIMIGSFSEREAPGLSDLLEELRSIDDYPFGSSSPFQDARIQKYWKKAE